MKIELLPQKAIKIKDNLIIADLHLGYEESLAQEGIYLPKAFNQMLTLLKGLVLRERPKRLIINGDLKHSFVPFRREKIEVEAFFSEILPLVREIIVIRGNHDVGIFWIKSLGIEVLDEIEISEWKVVHGHKLVEGDRFIIGHEHPSIRLRDEVGALIKVPIFLKGEDLVVLPAFSPWAYGNDILREIVSPFLRDLNSALFEVLVPLETELLSFGKLSELVEALRRM
ncbi:metallophosphoesterase [Thermococcus sp. EP1]|uniref:metallophosphoesterase n=1 Tax=Thermococcus sp. EP1 TaxID=1591054 RepID=UPI0006D947AE|nr:metallophosphoesterase [Thermococcus sp. EP1]KPU63570.1 metallophosphoesterase [Thermococcus sp. EP1]